MFYLLTFRLKPQKFISATLFEPKAKGPLDVDWMAKHLIKTYRRKGMTLSRVKVTRLPPETTKEDAELLLKTFPRPLKE